MIYQIEFMEEKLVENLTMLCEIINGEYVSASKAQTGRFEVMKKAGCLQFPTAVYGSTPLEHCQQNNQRHMKFMFI